MEYMAMGVNRELDASLAEGIVSPSPDFRLFVHDYFGDWQYYTRREEDREVVGRLTGIERETAVAMILENLHTGRSHIIDAAARINLKSAIPPLEAMWVDNAYSDYEHFEIARALHALGAMTSEELYAFLERTLHECGEFPAYGIMWYCYTIFPPDKAQRLINIVLCRGNYLMRAAAYRAAVAVNYIRSHGGTFTAELAHEIWQKESDAANVGTEQPDFYTGLQYYAGDKVFADKALFEQRRAQLWQPDRTKRLVPLFTEINEKHGAH